MQRSHLNQTFVGLGVLAVMCPTPAFPASEPVDPSAEWIKKMDAAPPEQRVPHWEHIRALMSRSAPAVGQSAPDFTLKTPDGAQSITRSIHHPDRPLVLVLASFT